MTSVAAAIEYAAVKKVAATSNERIVAPFLTELDKSHDASLEHSVKRDPPRA